MHVYLAAGLHPDRLPGDDEMLSPEKYFQAEVGGVLESDALEDAKSVAELALALPRLPGIEK